MGVDRYRVCELYAAGPESEGSGSGYRVSDRLVLTARHVIAPALPGGKVLARPVGVTEWLLARVDWQDADADAALIVIKDEGWLAPAGESVLRWGELAGSDPVPCAAVGFPWASVRPDRMRDAAHVYGQLAPLGQLRQGRLDLDVASASPTAREGGSPWAGMSGSGVIADNHLVGVITVDPARYQDRLVAVPARRLLADPGFQAVLAAHEVPAEVALVGGGWLLRLPGGQTVSPAPVRTGAVHAAASRARAGAVPGPRGGAGSHHRLVPGSGWPAGIPGDRRRGIGQDPAGPGGVRADAGGRMGRRAGR